MCMEVRGIIVEKKRGAMRISCWQPASTNPARMTVLIMAGRITPLSDIMCIG